MSASPLRSVLYHKDGGDDDMSYLMQPRGQGWVFRMETPDLLAGTQIPWTGKPFGGEIKKGLGTRRKREAMSMRDKLLGMIRELEEAAHGSSTFTLDMAERWRSVLEEHAASAAGDPYEIDPQAILEDIVEAEKFGRASKRKATDEELETFKAVAVRSETPISQALPKYLFERGEDASRWGFAALKPATVRDVKTAVAYAAPPGPRSPPAVVHA